MCLACADLNTCLLSIVFFVFFIFFRRRKGIVCVVDSSLKILFLWRCRDSRSTHCFWKTWPSTQVTVAQPVSRGPRQKFRECSILEASHIFEPNSCENELHVCLNLLFAVSLHSSHRGRRGKRKGEKSRRVLQENPEPRQPGSERS